MGGGPTVRQQIDRCPINVVVLVLRGLFLQTVDKNLEISLGDGAEELIRRCVVEINHCVLHRLTLMVRLKPDTTYLTSG